MSTLYLKSEYRNGRTVLSDVDFTAPIKIAKPFYHNEYTEAMIMTASAGILEGDYFEIRIDAENNSKLRITGQSYTKLFAATQNGAAQNTVINVMENAELYYFPTPVIPFGSSIFRNNTEIYLCKTSRFAMLDVISCGRKAMNEVFAFKAYRSKITVYLDNKPVFIDNQILIPDEMDLFSIGFFEKYTHTGMLYIYGFKLDGLPESDNVEAGFSRAKEGICIRILGNSSDEIVRYANEIIKNF